MKRLMRYFAAYTLPFVFSPAALALPLHLPPAVINCAAPLSPLVKVAVVFPKPVILFPHIFTPTAPRRAQDSSEPSSPTAPAEKPVAVHRWDRYVSPNDSYLYGQTSGLASTFNNGADRGSEHSGLDHYDNSFISGQPGWISDSLRLDFIGSFARPKLPTIHPSTATDQELQQQELALEQEAYLRKNQAIALHSLLNRRAEFDTENLLVEDARKGQLILQQYILNLRQHLEELRRSHFLCRIGVYCGEEFKTAKSNLDQAIASEARYAADLTKTKPTQAKQKLSDAETNFKVVTQRLIDAGVRADADHDSNPGRA